MPDHRRNINPLTAARKARTASPPATRPGAWRRAGDDLHICPSCSCNLVHPLEWTPVDSENWRVELWCPNCKWGETQVHPQRVLDRFDLILDDATESLLDDLAALQQSNMEEELERFAYALAHDQILPEDF